MKVLEWIKSYGHSVFSFFVYFLAVLLVLNYARGDIKVHNYVKENEKITELRVYPARDVYRKYDKKKDFNNDIYCAVTEAEVNARIFELKIFDKEELVKNEYILNERLFEKAKDYVGLKYADFAESARGDFGGGDYYISRKMK